MSTPALRKNASWSPDDSSFFRTTIGPLAIMLSCPILVRVLLTIFVSPETHLLAAISHVQPSEWPSPSMDALLILLGFILFQWILLEKLPGPEYFGPVTRGGNRPQYRLNGLTAYFLTHTLLLVGHFFVPGFRVTYLMDIYPSFVMSCEVVGLFLCFTIYLKGIYAPCTSDHSTMGNIVFDFWNGTELHPTFLGTNIKQLFNCRVSMTGWSVIALACMLKQLETHGSMTNSMFVSGALQIIYLAKFFYWESGYFGTLDIIHDRFGFYICWGVMTWVPAIYPISTVWLVKHPIELSPALAGALFVLGICSIILNYQVDAQKQLVRATGGKCKIWGEDPVLIVGNYVTEDGKKRSNLLLASGWWAVSRHFHYVPELILAYSWSLPALFFNIVPYTYAIFLTILLTDRAYRDDERCRFKYGHSWGEYCKRVPYRILPGIF
eukprot:TRINITY_DN1678_c0_g1_i2.p1 TRINITY_DN1678_c0_g1~~TRINITY_DN1678_c0_g1_i2.p1  ORF type:complete len:437 (-),score=76.19 TRINITY_DN1678_c0_g1_i2:406-1716(-)